MFTKVPSAVESGFSYDLDAETALVIAEAGPARDTAVRVAVQAGLAVRAPIGFAEAAWDLSHYNGLHAVLLELQDAPEALIEPVLVRLDTLVAERCLRIVAAFGPDQIDRAFGLLGPRAQLLCAPSETERLSAVVLARCRGQAALHDVTRDGESLRLQKLHEEVARIADALARMTEREEGLRPAGLRDDTLNYRGADFASEVDASEIRRTIRARRMRAQFFGPELFADPAWDMLLDLFAADLEKRQVSVSSLCIAAAVPPTTALRWIGTLHEAGLFERHADPSDRRRAYIGLSVKAQDGMRGYVAAVRRAGLNLV